MPHGADLAQEVGLGPAKRSFSTFLFQSTRYQVIAHRAGSDAATARDLPDREQMFVFESEDFDDLTHDELLSGHGTASMDRLIRPSTFCVTSPERIISRSLPPTPRGAAGTVRISPEPCPDWPGTLSETSGMLSGYSRNPVRIESESVSE